MILLRKILLLQLFLELTLTQGEELLMWMSLDLSLLYGVYYQACYIITLVNLMNVHKHVAPSPSLSVRKLSIKHKDNDSAHIKTCG